MRITYSVLEYAGCIDERAFEDFRTLEEARSWMRDAYDPHQIETLGIRIVREVDGRRVSEALAASAEVAHHRRAQPGARPCPPMNATTSCATR